MPQPEYHITSIKMNREQHYIYTKTIITHSYILLCMLQKDLHFWITILRDYFTSMFRTQVLWGHGLLPQVFAWHRLNLTDMNCPLWWLIDTNFLFWLTKTCNSWLITDYGFWLMIKVIFWDCYLWLIKLVYGTDKDSCLTDKDKYLRLIKIAVCDWWAICDW